MMKARIESVNLAVQRTLEWQGRRLATGIFKIPASHPVAAGRLGLEGDVQVDLRFHGGEDKAVYAYPAEHYPAWKEIYPNLPMPPGWFGENLTITGLLEEDVRLGDLFRAGTALLRATQPRYPCNKLAAKFGSAAVIEQMIENGRTGMYFAVDEPGIVKTGDELVHAGRAAGEITIADLNGLKNGSIATDRLRLIAESPEVGPKRKEQAQRELRKRA